MRSNVLKPDLLQKEFLEKALIPSDPSQNSIEAEYFYGKPLCRHPSPMLELLQTVKTGSYHYGIFVFVFFKDFLSYLMENEKGAGTTSLAAYEK